MAERISDNRRGGVAPAVLMAAAVFVLALPSAVLAFSTRIDLPADGFVSNSGLNAMSPARVDPRLARMLAASSEGGKGPIFRFTPAGLAARPDRSVTVAVRVDPATARAIVVRGAIGRPDKPVAQITMAPGAASLGIASTAYNLGLSRGYEGFAQPAPNLAIGQEIRKIDMPDLASFRTADKPSDASAGAPARLVPQISLAEHDRPGRTPRTLEGMGTQTVDLGGSYRLSRNLDVTAGLRYERDRDRLDAQLDGKGDTQAVFVGTQFHF